MTHRVSAGAALFFALLVATLVVAVLVVRARTPDLVLEVTEPPADVRAVFRPAGGRPPRELTITFFVREPDDRAFVGIVDRHEDLVRTLDPDVALAAREPVTYIWDGRDDEGELVASGRYRLLVGLPSEDREMVWPRRFTVVGGGPG